MRIAHRLILSMSLASATLFVSSCNKTAKYEIHEPHNASAQIFAFRLQSEANKDLEKYAFSIENKNPEGLIRNIKPLPFGTELKDVQLSMTLAADTKAMLTIGSGNPEEWSDSKKYTLPANTAISIRVTHNNNKEYTYSYKIELNQYAYDPETISWERLSQPMSATLLSSGQGAYVFTNSSDGKAYLAESNPAKFYDLQAMPTLSEKVFAGLPTGTAIKRLVSNASEAYLLTTTNKLYALRSGQWEERAVPEVIHDILGILPAYGTAVSSRLALVVGTMSTGYKFAAYGPDAFEVGTAIPPKYFPCLHSGDSFSPFDNVSTYEGSSLKLIGATPADDAGKSTRATWFTSNGTSWAVEYSELLEGATPSAMSVLKADDTYYRLETTASGLVVYHSTDRLHWTKSKDVAKINLPEGELVGVNMMAWAFEGKVYLLYRSATDNSLQLWRGELLKSKV